MVVVFFESKSHAEFAGIFPDEETYMKCLPALESYAKENRMTVTESLGQETIVKELKRLLEQQGYYTDRLYQLEDVQAKFDCTDEQAQKVLDNAMNNEATTNQIWESIDCAADVMDIKKREPKNLTWFRSLAKETPLEESNDTYDGIDNMDCVIMYEGFEIGRFKDGMHILIIGRSDYYGTLEELEPRLWDFAKFENETPVTDIEEDLHQRCRDIMTELDEKYGKPNKRLSLDEYYAEYISLFEEQDLENIKYLLDEFDEL